MIEVKRNGTVISWSEDESAMPDFELTKHMMANGYKFYKDKKLITIKNLSESKKSE